MNSGSDPSLKLPLRRSGKRRVRYSLLSSWYGPERASVEIAAHTGEAQPIASLLDQVLTQIDRPENGILIRLRGEWSHIAGSTLSRFSTPLSLQNGILTLCVRHSAMIPELQMTCDLMQKRINDFCGEVCCRKIRFSVGKV